MTKPSAGLRSGIGSCHAEPTPVAKSKPSERCERRGFCGQNFPSTSLVFVRRRRARERRCTTGLVDPGHGASCRAVSFLCPGTKPFCQIGAGMGLSLDQARPLLHINLSKDSEAGAVHRGNSSDMNAVRGLSSLESKSLVGRLHVPWPHS